MPKKKQVDYKKLLKMVRDEVHKSEIMEAFDFKTVTQLKTAMAEAMMEEGAVPNLVGGRGSKAKDKDTIKVNKRGSLVITKDMVSEFGFNVGDEFKVKPVKYGLQVRKAGDDGEGED